MESKTSTTGDFSAVWALYKTFTEFLQENVKGIETCFITKQTIFKLVEDFVSYTKSIKVAFFFHIISLFTAELVLRKRRYV